MILSDKDIYYALEFRIKTKSYIGTLCKMPDDRQHLIHAMAYFDIWDWKGYITNPYSILDHTIFDNLTGRLFRILVEYNNFWGPKWHNYEIDKILQLAAKYEFVACKHGRQLYFTRPNSIHYRESPCTKH